MVRIVSFDLDGTLVTSGFADAVWLEGLPALYAKTHDVPLDEAKRVLFAQYDIIGDQRLEWYDPAYWFSLYNLPGDWRRLLHDHRGRIEVFPDATATLPRLAQQYPLVICSNAKREFVAIELEELRLAPFFSHIFSSTSDFHTVKKVPDFYSMVCSRLGVAPHEVLHVGDSRPYDYASAKDAGLSALYLDRSMKETGPSVIHTLFEVEAWLASEKDGERKRLPTTDP
jgi:putative hydrolase of the HAD superfamily